MTYYIVHFGCKTNKYDAVALTLPLTARGCREVASPAEADIIIVNTCTVTARSDAKARARVRHLHRENPEASIIVSGCSVLTQGKRITSLPGVELALGVGEVEKFLRFIDERNKIGTDGVQPKDIIPDDFIDPWESGIRRFPGRSRAYLKIQDGCDNRCTYCVIPSVRGRSRSRLPDTIVREARALLSAGHPELVLTGIHIGCYGKDLDPQIGLIGLIHRLLSETVVSMLRLGSLNADEVSGDLLDLMSSEERIARHLHIPLQSGSDRVLGSMARSYRREKFVSVVERAVDSVPVINIGSDVIVGFPTEEEMDFDESYHLIDNLPIGYLHVFRYSDRPGMRSTGFTKNASSKEITSRCRRMKRLGEQKRVAFLRKMLGQELLAVYEKQSEGREALYRSTNYLKLFVEDPMLRRSPIILTPYGFTEDGLRCRQAVGVEEAVV